MLLCKCDQIMLLSVTCYKRESVDDFDSYPMITRRKQECVRERERFFKLRLYPMNRTDDNKSRTLNARRLYLYVYLCRNKHARANKFDRRCRISLAS